MKKNTTMYAVLIIVIILGIVYFALNKPIVATLPQAQVFVAASAPKPAVITLISVSKPETAAVGLASALLIKWNTSNYPASARVNINLIKLDSATPKIFSFVRAIATDIQNDGEEIFVPTARESGDKYYIEVVCSAESTFTAGCSVNSQPMKAF